MARKMTCCGGQGRSLRSAKPLKYQAGRVWEYMGEILRRNFEPGGREFESLRAHQCHRFSICPRRRSRGGMVSPWQNTENATTAKVITTMSF